MANPNELKKVLNSALPETILPGPNLTPSQSESYLRRILMKNLPSSDVKNLHADLEWQFLLDKHSLRKKRIVKRKKTFLTRKQRLEMNLLKLPREGWSYASLEPIRNMWKDYMRENLDLARAPNCADPEWTSFSTIVAKSELVGAEMAVVKSKVPNQIGVSGTVVLETKMTLQIVTPQSKLKTLLKNASVFQFRLDDMRFTVYGKHIATRPSERSTKKIKSQMIPDL